MIKMEQGITEVCYQKDNKCAIELKIVHNNRHFSYFTPVFDSEHLNANRVAAWGYVVQLIMEEINANALELKNKHT